MLLCACRMNPTRPRPKVWHARRNVETTKVRLVTRQGVLALAFDHHLRRGVHRVGAQREFKLVMIVQGQTDRIETGAKIGAGGRNLHTHLAGNWSHLSSSFVTSSLQIKHRIPWQCQSQISGGTAPVHRIRAHDGGLAWLACQAAVMGPNRIRYQFSTRRIDGSPHTQSSSHTSLTVSRRVSSSVMWVTRRSCCSSPS